MRIALQSKWRETPKNPPLMYVVVYREGHTVGDDDDTLHPTH